MKFKKFKKELEKRLGTKYHVVNKYDQNVFAEYESNGFIVNDDYLEFISVIGYGRFFSGDLTIFSLDEIKNLVTNLNKELLPIGYDGTTTGFYVLARDKEDRQIYWLDVQTDERSVVHKDFITWIETLPSQLFSSKIYKGHAKIKDLESIEKVINERRKFSVTIKSFDKTLVNPPDQAPHYLKRYNRIVVSITKNEESFLKQLTIIVKREGSDVRSHNKENVTIDTSKLIPGETQDFEHYVFDPFNLPFEKITCDYDYQIDLNSSDRIRYNEISEYL